MKITFNSGPSITISASADDWELYLGESEEQEQERDFVADQINWQVEDIVRKNTEPLKAYLEADKVLVSFKRWGAADTEPRGYLQDIIEKAYGAKI